MTGDGLARSVPELDGGSSAQLPVPVLLGLCDGLLGEIGRRRHLFAWLRPPGSGTEDWLVVDAYYPSNRLVVVCHEEPADHDHLYGELVPRHGLRLLRLAPAELGGDRSEAEPALRKLIAELGPAPPRPTEPALDDEPGPRDGAMARVAASLAQAAAQPVVERKPVGPVQAAAVQRATRLVAARKAVPVRVPRNPAAARPGVHRPAPVPRPRAADAGHPRAGDAAHPRAGDAAHPRAGDPAHPRAGDPAHSRPRRDSDADQATNTVGLLVGLTLSAVLCAELYLGVGKLALNGDHWLLAFGISLDACARALGVIAAERSERRDWAWWCVLGGSPAVAQFVLFEPEGPVATHPAPLAGLLSVLAVLMIAIALLAAVIRI